MDNRPVVYWILQENQVTPTIIEFLKFFVQRIPNLNIQFLIPSIWTTTLEVAAPLNPVPFDGVIHHDESYDWVCRKRDALGELKLPGGLDVWRVLLLDDMNGGRVSPVIPKLPETPNLKFMIMQLPIPLGSTDNEERMAYACIHWAHQRKIPIIGYELLPFDTKWTMVQALVDGVITNNERSHDWLTSEEAAIPGRVWSLPRYEGRLFTAISSQFWRKAIGIPHHFAAHYKVAEDALVLYIPHNVAMSFEYKQLIRHLSQSHHKIHLMISVGKDQGRGTHTHQEIVETLSREALGKFATHSFHDLNNTLDMALADAVIACSSCYATLMADQNAIPSLIIDPDVTPHTNGHIKAISSLEELDHQIDDLAQRHGKVTRLEKIFIEILTALKK
ncbi:MAG: hypothetical protein MI747_12300 [Desulfobacterales bacterium]|nr:hypothetical protein [Desulfobacterales bacterium]